MKKQLLWFTKQLEAENRILLQATPISMATTANVYHLTLKSDREILEAFVKCPPETENEWMVCKYIYPFISEFTPQLLGIYEEGKYRAILLLDESVPEKSSNKHTTDLNLYHNTNDEWITDALPLVLRMHLECSSYTEHWLQAGWTSILQPYKLEPWRTRGLTALEEAYQTGQSPIEIEWLNQPRLWSYINETYQGRTTWTHGDLHRANWVHSRRGWLLIDWAYAYVSTPYRDMAMLLSEAANLHAACSLWSNYVTNMKEAGWKLEEKFFLLSLVDHVVMMIGFLHLTENDPAKNEKMQHYMSLLMELAKAAAE